MSTDSITLSNGIILKPQNMVKWLGIWIDQKLTFKTHVDKRVALATRVLHSIDRLQNSEWGLTAMATRQLYQTCITAISDYGSEIWWNNQKSHMQKYQKLQNLGLKKILKAFKISPIAAIKIKANIPSIEVRLNQKNQKLALQIIKIDNKHPIRLKTPRNFFTEYGSPEPPKLLEPSGFPEFTESSELIDVLKNENSDQFEN